MAPSSYIENTTTTEVSSLKFISGYDNEGKKITW